MKCKFNEPGCQIEIKSRNPRSTCCSNLACKKRRHREFFSKYRKEGYIQKGWVKKFCIGFYCQGNVEKKILIGKRMCAKCTEYANENDY